MVVTFVARNPQRPRTMEAGVILSAKTLKSEGQSNQLEEEVDKDGQVFITRKGIKHLAIPTIREYHLVAKPLTQLHIDMGKLPNRGVLDSSASWMYSAVTNINRSGFFFLAQGNLLRLIWAYPVIQVPVILASASVTMMYYNMTAWDITHWLGTQFYAFLGFLSSWMVDQLGDPAGKFAFAIGVLYLIIMSMC